MTTSPTRLLVLVLLAAPARADVIFVDGQAGPGGNGGTWKTAFMHPEDALDVAIAGDEIWVAAGTYGPRPDDTCSGDDAGFVLVSGVAMYGGFAGGERWLEQRDPVANPTILTGLLETDPDPCCLPYPNPCTCEPCREVVCAQMPPCCEHWDIVCALFAQLNCDIACPGDAAAHVITASATGPGTRLDGFIVSGGLAPGDESGGGLLVIDGTLEVSQCTFTDSQAGVGGAVALYSASAVISSCSFLANRAHDGLGGVDTGVGGAIAVHFGAIDIVSCSFEGNLAAGGRGGAIAIEHSLAMITGCSFTENFAGRGGAVHLTDADVDVLGCSFADNEASSRGGAIHNDQGCLVIDACVLSGPSDIQGGANGLGGGIMSQAGQTTVRHSAFLGLSTAGRGGAIATITGAQTTLTDCWFQDNIAFEGGGAIWCAEANLHANRSRFIRNWAALESEPPTPAHQSSGGAVRSLDAVMGFDDCEFSGNVASGWGGAVMQIGPQALFRRCVFQGNEAVWQGGGAAYLNDGFSQMIDCTIVDNRASWGGGVVELEGRSIFTSCRLERNRATRNSGGAVFCWDNSTSAFENCLFVHNESEEEAGAIGSWRSSRPSFVNCTIVANVAGGAGAALHVGGESELPGIDGSSEAELTNCILRDNLDGAGGGDQVSIGDPGSLIVVEYSDVSGSFPGPGNIDADVLFIDPSYGDYRLAAGSPCIDAGDNGAMTAMTDLAGAPRRIDDPNTPDTGLGDPPVVDMGAYEFQADGCPADCDGDGVVDAADLLALLAAWGSPGPCALDGDGVVDEPDLDALLAAWGPCP